MMKFKKLFSILAAAVMLVQILPIREVMAASDICYIKTADDFTKLSAKCKNEKYSKDLSVFLTADIDLRGSNFKPLPYFSGTFDGRDYTISGISIKKKGSSSGLIRDNSGTVKNLTAEAVVMPEGTKKNIGIIAGKNTGSIINCTAKGSVEGKENIGGIAGQNKGTINNCNNYAEIKGDLKTGGIAGLNDGVIENCYNYGTVNNRSKSRNDSDSIVKINLESLRVTDTTLYEITGGIAGQNNDIIKNSHNFGEIGYLYVGSKTGGIAGVQSGNISDCTNNAVIFGKSEIGGIVGRLIPELVTQYSDKADNIDKSLKNTRSSIDNLSDNLSNNKLERYFDNIIDVTGDIQDSISAFSDDFSGDADEIIDIVKTQNDILKEQTDGLIEEFDTFSDDLKKDIDETNAAVDDFRDAIDNIKEIRKLVSGDLRDTIDTHLDNIEDTADIMSGDIDAVSDDIDAIKKLVDDIDDIMTGDESASDKARRMAEVFEDYNGNSIAYSLKRIRRRIEDIEEYSDVIIKNFQQVQRSVDEVFNTVSSVKRETENIVGEILGLISGMSESELAALSEISKLLQSGNITAEDVQKILAALGESADDMADFLQKAQKIALKTAELIAYLRDADDNITDAYGVARSNINSLISNLSKVYNEFEDIVELTEVIVVDLQEMYDVAKECKDIILGDDTEEEKLYKLADALDEYEAKDVDLKESFDKLRETAVSLKDEVTALRKDVEPINDKISDYADEFSEEAEKASDRLDAAVNKTSDDIKSFTDKMSDRMKIVSSSLDTLSDSLTDFLSDTNQSSKRLIDDLDGSNDSLRRNATSVKDEVKSMKNQFRDDFDKVMDNVGETGDRISELTDNPERTSLNVYSNLDGKGVIVGCENKAAVKGRTRAGGISGTAAVNLKFEETDDDDENENEDIISYADKKLNGEDDDSDKGRLEKASNSSDTSVSAVIAYCTNSAEVTTKSDYAGGIIGRGYMGVVYKCADTEYITSTNGGYVGGIAGRSAGDIISSYAAVTVTGDKYLGGIVGSGNNVSDCVSIASYISNSDTEDAEAYGAVAGYIGGSAKNNIYSGEGFAGIDDVDYPGAAYAVSYTELISKDGIPDMFKKMRVRFIADDKIIKEVFVDYGSELLKKQIPGVPDNGEGYGEWEEFDASSITNYLRVYAEYSKFTTTLGTGENKARVLAEGEFTSNAELKVSDYIDSVGGCKTLFGYSTNIKDVKVPDEVKYRVLCEDSKKNLKVYVDSGRGFEERAYDIDGSYLVFNAPSDGAFIIVKPQIWKYIAAAIALAALLAAVVFVNRKRLRLLIKRK